MANLTSLSLPNVLWNIPITSWKNGIWDHMWNMLCVIIVQKGEGKDTIVFHKYQME